MPQDTCPHLFAGRCDLGRVLATPAVEHHDFRAGFQPQDAREMRASLRRQRELAGCLERRGHMDAGQAHAISMPDVVTRASRSISSGSMTYGGMKYTVVPSGRSSAPCSSACR